MKIIVFGIPGVGKSTIVKKVIQSQNLQRIVWGDIVEQIALEKDLVKNRDLIRKLNKTIQKELQELVVKKLVLLSRNNNTVIETHAVIKTKFGFLPGLNLEFLKILKPDLFVVIEADPQSVFKRRIKDKTRMRDDDRDIAEIEFHLELTRQFAVSFASIVGANLSIIQNKEGKIEETANKLEEIIKNI